MDTCTMYMYDMYDKVMLRYFTSVFVLSVQLHNTITTFLDLSRIPDQAENRGFLGQWRLGGLSIFPTNLLYSVQQECTL
jgi:hypothetical protein